MQSALGIHDIAIFLATAILLNLTPGQDTFYIIGRSISGGRSAGIASALGIGAGSIIHTCFAALGLSALLAASASAFFVVKLIGAVYLIYLGIKLMLKRGTTSVTSTRSGSTFASIFWQGLVTNLLNPKVALFFLAFMPQFITVDSPSKFLSFLVLGSCFVITGTTWCLCIAWFASTLRQRLRNSTIVTTWMNRAAGTVFMFLGIRLATTR